MFVSFGLFLTFLGLISALNSMTNSLDGSGSSALQGLLSIASAKFIMSLSGLLCSIIFTIIQRRKFGMIEKLLHELNMILEKKYSYISLEEISQKQLDIANESRTYLQGLGAEIAAALTRPLEDFPKVMSESLNAAISPVIEQVSRMGNDGVGAMVEDLSNRFSDDVGRALKEASDRISLAGDQIRMLAERMDQSSGRMNEGMEQAVMRLGAAAESLKDNMASSAKEAQETLTQGTENLLNTMNTTLEGIRENTGEGAKAMVEAAEGMKQAAIHIRQELENAATHGAEAAKQKLNAASDNISKITQEISAKSQAQLLNPLDEIAQKLQDVSERTSETSHSFRRIAENINQGALASEKASNAFTLSSDHLLKATNPISAMIERIENTTRALKDSTENQLASIATSAQDNARSAAATLEAAQEALGGQHQEIRATLKSLEDVIYNLKGQGERLLNIDKTLGNAFETYQNQVQLSIDTLSSHVTTMQGKLSPALDTMREIVEQAENFIPHQQGRS